MGGLGAERRSAEIRRATRRRQDRRRREQLRANGPPERYTLQQIGDHDGWMCGSAARRIDRAFTRPHPCSPSVQHVVAVMAQGGPDTGPSRELK
jgi:hypothetical protein